MPNRHGLTRTIPTATAAEIRRRSKFGCVHCRNAIYQYEHIDPAFADAVTHDPDHMCLLCGGCHDRVTRGQLSKATVRAAYDRVRNSPGIKAPWSDFDLNSNDYEVGLGSSTFYSPKEIFRVNGEVLLAFQAAEEPGMPPRLSGAFFDRSGSKIMEIAANEWCLPTDLADCEIKGQTIRIASRHDDSELVLGLRPPKRIEVLSLHMRKDGADIRLVDDLICVREVAGEILGKGIAVGFQCWHPQICVDITVDTAREFAALKIEGGQGITAEGIRFGVGSGKMLLQRVEVFLGAGQPRRLVLGQD